MITVNFMYKKLFIYTIIFTFIDQVSKGLINIYLNLNQSVEIIPNFLSFTYVHNTGAAFSIFEGAKCFFIIIAFIALNIIYLFFIKDKKLKNSEIVIYALLISGIIGNLIDRILFGYVIDFIDVNIFNFAIFNLADSFIVVAVILLLIMMGGKNARTNSGNK